MRMSSPTQEEEDKAAAAGVTDTVVAVVVDGDVADVAAVGTRVVSSPSLDVTRWKLRKFCISGHLKRYPCN